MNVTFKGILPVSKHFQVEETIILGKTGLYCRIEEILVSARKYHLTSNLECTTQCSPLRTGRVIQRIIYQQFPVRETITLRKIVLFCRID
jgi:hypothetical protein